MSLARPVNDGDPERPRGQQREWAIAWVDDGSSSTCFTVVVDSRTHARAPLRILCQHEGGSCAACCGAYNFRDRSNAAEHARLVRRTERVKAAWPDVDKLARARDELLALEKPDVLFAGVKVCPFAGYVDEIGEGARIGCMLHPTRHPTGEDLRDLAVYPKEICAGHFCAPHDWLRAREADLAQTATGTYYGRVVTDAGLVKAIATLVDEALGRPFTSFDLVDHARATRAELDALWALCRAWPYADPDPARFGGFHFSGAAAVERTLPSAMSGTHVKASHAQRVVLDALGTRALDDVEAQAALALLDDAIARVASAMRATPG